MTWTFKTFYNHARRDRRYQLRYTPDRGRPYIRNYTRLKIRQFADVATDALLGTPTTIGPYRAEHLEAGLVEVTEKRTVRTGVLTFELTELESIIAHIDEAWDS